MAIRRTGEWLRSRLGGGQAQATLERAKPLSIVTEAEALQPASDATASCDPPPFPGLLERAVEAVVPGGEPTLFSVAGGPALPDWARNAGDAVRYAVDLARVGDVHQTPNFGAVIDRKGRVFKSPVAGARYLTPRLDALPHVKLHDGVAHFAPSGDEPRRASASIFVPWGARYNYGHFLLDALPSLVLIADRGLLARFPAVAPRLNSWQRELLRLVLRESEGVEELEADLIHVDDLLFCSSMDHFLHAPNAPLDSVRRRILTAVPPGASPPAERIYLTRRTQTKRVMVNEDRLEAALVERGFRVIEPERLSVTEQVEIFRSAEVVVSATGAGLANVLFAPPGAMVVEIQPSNYEGIWVRALAQYVGARWYGFFCASPLTEKRVEVGGETRFDVLFEWGLPLSPFLAFLDAHLPSEPA